MSSIISELSLDLSDDDLEDPEYLYYILNAIKEEKFTHITLKEWHPMTETRQFILKLLLEALKNRKQYIRRISLDNVEFTVEDIKYFNQFLLACPALTQIDITDLQTGETLDMDIGLTLKAISPIIYQSPTLKKFWFAWSGDFGISYTEEEIERFCDALKRSKVTELIIGGNLPRNFEPQFSTAFANALQPMLRNNAALQSLTICGLNLPLTIFQEFGRLIQHSNIQELRLYRVGIQKGEESAGCLQAFSKTWVSTLLQGPLRILTVIKSPLFSYITDEDFEALMKTAKENNPLESLILRDINLESVINKLSMLFECFSKLATFGCQRCFISIEGISKIQNFIKYLAQKKLTACFFDVMHDHFEQNENLGYKSHPEFHIEAIDVELRHALIPVIRESSCVKTLYLEIEPYPIWNIYYDIPSLFALCNNKSITTLSFWQHEELRANFIYANERSPVSGENGAMLTHQLADIFIYILGEGGNRTLGSIEGLELPEHPSKELQEKYDTIRFALQRNQRFKQSLSFLSCAKHPPFSKAIGAFKQVAPLIFSFAGWGDYDRLSRNLASGRRYFHEKTSAATKPFAATNTSGITNTLSNVCVQAVVKQPAHKKQKI